MMNYVDYQDTFSLSPGSQECVRPPSFLLGLTQ